MLYRYMLILLILLVSNASGLTRDLVVVNSLGETADYAKLTEGTIKTHAATLGLAPNDFIVVGNTGIAINSTSNDLYFFSLPDMSLLGKVYLGGGRSPYAGALIDSNHLLVTNIVASTVSKVRISDSTVLGEYSVGRSPEGVIVIGQQAYVCITGLNYDDYSYGQGYIDVFDLTSNTVVKSIAVGTNPQDIALGYDGSLYVICSGNYVDRFGVLYKLSRASNTVVDSLPIGGSPSTLAITRSGIMFLSAGGWGSNGKVYTVDMNTFSVVHGPTNPIHTGAGVYAVVAVSDSTIVSCNFSDDSITELTPSGLILMTLRTGDGPVAAAKYPSCYVRHGDADGSGSIDISDAVFVINRIFAGGVPPVTTAAGDYNCDGTIDISDAVSVISYIFTGGSSSCGCAD